MTRQYQPMRSRWSVAFALLIALAAIVSFSPTAQAKSLATSCNQVSQIGPTYYWHDLGTNYTQYVAFQRQYDFYQNCAVRMHIWVVTTGNVVASNYGGSGYDVFFQGIGYYGTLYAQTHSVLTPRLLVPHYATTVHAYTAWTPGPCMHGIATLTDYLSNELWYGNPIYGPADPPYTAYKPAGLGSGACI